MSAAPPDTQEIQRARREEARRLELRIAAVLRAGVLAATAFLGAGLPFVVARARSGGEAELSVGRALRQLPSLRPESLAALGVVILVATPVVQLLTSAVLFWRKRDRLYVGLAVLVLAIVAVGALVTRGGG
jgi:uncharacterized membrane protein